MAKDNKKYVCSNCGNESIKWYGKCLACGEFGTIDEVTVSSSAVATEKAGFKNNGSVTPTRKAMSITELNNKPIARTATGIGELDRVLGGGFVDGEVIVLGGLPGSGKSSLSLIVAEKYANMGKTVLYVSGEESEQQIGLRARRFGITNENIKIVSETNLETILGHMDEVNPDFMIVDSLQTIASTEVNGSMGSISQSKEAAHTLTNIAKKRTITMIQISQVVKGGGDFSGSESIQHIVDCGLIFESDNDTPLKFLRATKNRFGDTTEVGVFQHVENGLEEVSDPSGIFLETNDDNVTGAACSFMSEGTRSIPLEVQSLVNKSLLPQPRKQFNGVQHQRGQIVCAILDKFCSARLFENDVFVSTVSGVRVFDPQSDLAIAASIMSSLKNAPISNEYCFLGELSLTGQVRGAFMIENKIREAARLGFTKIVIPHNAVKNSKRIPSDIELIKIKNVKEILQFIK